MNHLKRLVFAISLCIFSFNVFAEIIFETDFADDGNFYVGQQQAQWSKIAANKPKGFDGALITGSGGYIKGVPGAGVGGSVALKLMWDPALGQPTTQLYKHLTGDHSTGYDDIYIRYKLRLPNNFKAGIPSNDSIPYWKFGRLWQNTSTVPVGGSGGGWTENRSDSFYAVWNFGGTDMWGADAGATFAANSGINLNQGSAGGERYSNDYYIGRRDYSITPGHFRHVGNGAWDFHSDTRMLKNRNQTWHTIEWRFKLSSSSTSGDGVFQMWFDGVEQVPVGIGQGGDTTPIFNPPLAPTANPTARHGSGYNMLVMFDNMAQWNKNWDDAGIEGGLYVNDLVISNKRIGHTYSVGIAPPKPPSSLRAVNEQGM